MSPACTITVSLSLVKYGTSLKKKNVWSRVFNFSERIGSFGIPPWGAKSEKLREFIRRILLIKTIKSNAEFAGLSHHLGGCW